MPLLALVPFVILAIIALIPIAIVQRFRTGTARRRARGWVVTVNLLGVTVSVATFLIGALITSQWVPDALIYTLAGLGLGCALGLFGLAVTRWDATGASLEYTPNRLLVLTITLVVAGRVFYGFWRTWNAWQAGIDAGALVLASGLAASMWAGAVVLGYYFIYWAGVRRRLRRFRRATL